MQFRKGQRTELSRTWNGSSWFFQVLGEPARLIIQRAYGLTLCTPRDRAKAQEDVTLALSIFAAEVGCEKGQAIHALLSGSITHLTKALLRDGKYRHVSKQELAWVEAFRKVTTGDLDVQET